ncbi:MAG: Ig-like domain-containing protein [Steroidobacteraceae bacterium]
MRKLLSTLALLMLAATLVGCGGTGAAFVSPSSAPGGGTGTGAGTVATITVTPASATISSDSSSSTGITVVAEDANHVAVDGAKISFSATAGTLQVQNGVTDASGKATAILSANGAGTGTAITVTASVGGISGTATVTVSSTQQTLTLLTSTPQIYSDGSATATITALVRDSSNNVTPGVLVSFVATAGALTNIQGTTDANGSATAQLTNAGDPTNRTITVTATAGTSSATVNVAVVGTSLVISGPSTLVQGSTGTFTVALTDYGKNGIGGKMVTLVSALGNTLSAASVTTSSTGQQTFTLKAVNAGTDTITASALGLTTTATVAVSAQAFAFTAPAPGPVAQVPIGVANAIPVTVVWQGAGGANQSVTFTTSRGTFVGGTSNTGSSTVATTDGTGTTSGITLYSGQAGPATITATGTGVTAQTTVNFVATVPATITLQASPSTISTQGQSTIIATVRDINNNLVPNQVVNFTLADITGGTLSLPSATTNTQGQASVVYTATATPSSANGVTVTATTGSIPAASASLTVGGQTVNLQLGTGNTIVSLNQTLYQMPYSAILADSGGHALTGVTVTFTLTPLAFEQGSRAWNGTLWATDSTTLSTDPHVFAQLQNPAGNSGAVSWGCTNEDANNDQIFDAGDYNGAGAYNAATNATDSGLYPGTVANLDNQQVVTTAGGYATVNITYPKDHAFWVALKLTATATVAGSQNSTSAIFWLPGLATDFTTQSVDPPGVISPYGTYATCGDHNYP